MKMSDDKPYTYFHGSEISTYLELMLRLLTINYELEY